MGQSKPGMGTNKFKWNDGGFTKQMRRQRLKKLGHLALKKAEGCLQMGGSI